MASAHLPWPAGHPEPAEKRRFGIGAGLLSIGPWNTGAGGCAGREDMPRKPVDIRPTDYPVRQKRGHCALFLPSGEDVFGRSPSRVKGLVPCGFSGQRPEPSESLPEPISAFFKVLLSLFFSAHFFITHLTLPSSSSLNSFAISGTLFPTFFIMPSTSPSAKNGSILFMASFPPLSIKKSFPSFPTPYINRQSKTPRYSVFKTKKVPKEPIFSERFMTYFSPCISLSNREGRPCPPSSPLCASFKGAEEKKCLKRRTPPDTV